MSTYVQCFDDGKALRRLVPVAVEVARVELDSDHETGLGGHNFSEMANKYIGQK